MAPARPQIQIPGTQETTPMALPPFVQDQEASLDSEFLIEPWASTEPQDKDKMPPLAPSYTLETALHFDIPLGAEISLIAESCFESDARLKCLLQRASQFPSMRQVEAHHFCQDLVQAVISRTRERQIFIGKCIAQEQQLKLEIQDLRRHEATLVSNIQGLNEERTQERHKWTLELEAATHEREAQQEAHEHERERWTKDWKVGEIERGNLEAQMHDMEAQYQQDFRALVSETKQTIHQMHVLHQSQQRAQVSQDRLERKAEQDAAELERLMSEQRALELELTQERERAEKLKLDFTRGQKGHQEEVLRWKNELENLRTHFRHEQQQAKTWGEKRERKIQRLQQMVDLATQQNRSRPAFASKHDHLNETSDTGTTSKNPTVSDMGHAKRDSRSKWKMKHEPGLMVNQRPEEELVDSERIQPEAVDRSRIPRDSPSFRPLLCLWKNQFSTISHLLNQIECEKEA